MFDGYEKIKCVKCNKVFSGRRPPDGISVLCPDHMRESELPLIDDGDKIPNDVLEHLKKTRED